MKELYLVNLRELSVLVLRFLIDFLFSHHTIWNLSANENKC